MSRKPGSGKAKVLVVEDSDAQRERLVAMLRARGYEVTEAAGGVEALRKIKDENPDVVLLDVILDDLDGYSVCRWLRLSDRTRDIVVIMLTVKGGVKERIEGLHVGADDYLPKPFDDDELDARIFAGLRARTTREELRQRNLELEGMLSRSEKLAMTDVVTGLYNRRRFLDMLRREWATSKRYSHPLSCVLFDLDNFKQVNDVDGHSAGDEALKKIAEILAGSIREVDVAARYGGDEFALLLPHTPRDRGVVVVERAQKRLSERRADWAGEQKQLGMSAGIASNEDPSITSPEQLIEAADRALYTAKRAGKGVVVAYDKILQG